MKGKCRSSCDNRTFQFLCIFLDKANITSQILMGFFWHFVHLKSFQLNFNRYFTLFEVKGVIWTKNWKTHLSMRGKLRILYYHILTMEIVKHSISNIGAAPQLYIRDWAIIQDMKNFYIHLILMHFIHLFFSLRTFHTMLTIFCFLLFSNKMG